MVHHECDDCGSVQQLRMLNRSVDTDVWCVSDGFQHFLWNILYSLVEIHEPFVYSRDWPALFTPYCFCWTLNNRCNSGLFQFRLSIFLFFCRVLSQTVDEPFFSKKSEAEAWAFTALWGGDPFQFQKRYRREKYFRSFSEIWLRCRKKIQTDLICRIFRLSEVRWRRLYIDQ